MRPILLIAGYLVVVFAGGSLLAPWLYACVQWGAAHWTGLEKVASSPFHRFVNRSFLIMAVAGLWPYLKAVGIRSCRDAGMPPIWPARNRLAWGFLAGWISLAAVALIAVIFGARQWDFNHTPAKFAGQLASSAATAIFVAILEESLFRGALYGSLRKTMRWPVAVMLSSAVFAILHFFQRPVSPSQVNWLSGLTLLPQMLRGFTDWDALAHGFFTLTIVGALLAIAYERTGNLYFSIGLHAGWIFWLKTYGFVTRELPDHSLVFWGTNKLTDGWISLIVICALALPVCVRLKPDRKDLS